MVDINARDNDGMTALHIAVAEESQKVVELLLTHNADLEIAKYDGSTPLCSAIENRNEAMVKLLLDAGAKADVSAENGMTPLHFAANSRLNREKIIQLLLDAGAEVNALSENGWTPLYVAIVGKCKSTSIQLLEAGADPNLSGDFNQTALHQAVYLNWTRIIDPLLSYGADPLLIDGFGRSCMDWASSASSVLSRKSTFAKLLRHCGNYRPTDSALIHEILFHSIGSIIRKLKREILETFSGPRATYIEGFRLLDRLARCLLFIGDTEEASIALKKSVYYAPGAGAMICDFCGSDMTAKDDRLICCSCPDIDACMMCAENCKNDPRCGGHRFWKASIDTEQNPLDGDVNIVSDLVDGWLAPLARKYNADISKEGKEYQLSVPDPAQIKDKFEAQNELIEKLV